MSIIKSGLTLLGLFLSMPVFAQEGIDSQINEAIKPYADAVAGFIFSSFPIAACRHPFYSHLADCRGDHLHVLFPVY